MSDGGIKNDEYWRDKLSAEEYAVCREKGTERPFTGALLNETTEGKYVCRCCQAELFDSSSKFESGCGWPSFSQSKSEEVIDEHFDDSLGMRRTEITCHKCGSHLGHVFTDGPAPSGLRYCVNSVSLQFESKGESSE